MQAEAEDNARRETLRQGLAEGKATDVKKAVKRKAMNSREREMELYGRVWQDRSSLFLEGYFDAITCFTMLHWMLHGCYIFEQRNRPNL
jgi:hypothetical protein